MLFRAFHNTPRTSHFNGWKWRQAFWLVIWRHFWPWHIFSINVRAHLSSFNHLLSVLKSINLERTYCFFSDFWKIDLVAQKKINHPLFSFRIAIVFIHCFAEDSIQLFILTFKLFCFSSSSLSTFHQHTFYPKSTQYLPKVGPKLTQAGLYPNSS